MRKRREKNIGEKERRKKKEKSRRKTEREMEKKEEKRKGRVETGRKKEEEEKNTSRLDSNPVLFPSKIDIPVKDIDTVIDRQEL